MRANCAGNLYRVIAPKTGVVQPIRSDRINAKVNNVKMIFFSSKFNFFLKKMVRPKNIRISHTSRKERNFNLLPGSFGNGRITLFTRASGMFFIN